MTDVTFVLHLPGRAGDRISVRRNHLPAQLAKPLAKLEEANTVQQEADRALEDCGFGTGPKRAAFEQTVREAEAVQAEALENLLGGSIRHGKALADSATDAYNSALDRFERAKREALDALAEACDAAALYACAQSPVAIIDVDHQHARRHPARNAANNAAAQLRQIDLPSLND
ncbi:hypothetical protein [Streptomyces sp. 061-3]|uniref:hypothetical protein n=1 Tax=Streptomyces sp. 061-3 TaxID=2789268 RepID=UPI003980B381